MIEIIPSILTTDKQTFVQNLNDAMALFSMAQIDIVDGIYAPTKTWSYNHAIEISSLLKNNFSIELHLMVADPKMVIEQWQHIPQVKRVLLDIETCDFTKFLQQIPSHWEVGLVINPNTQLSQITPYLQYAQSVMFMGVHPGKQGQTFQKHVLEKINLFKQKHPSFPVALDGGVNPSTLPSILKVGVDRICPGSALFGKFSVQENLKTLQKIIQDIH